MAFAKDDTSTYWEPAEVKDGGDKYAILLLNHALEAKSDSAKALFGQIWTKAALRIGVDGGNNALLAMDVPRPDIVCGDFDSIKPELIDHYKELGARIIETPDQDSTDFTKAVQIALEEQEQLEKGSRRAFECIVALGSLGGRLDQFLSNINTLYIFSDRIPILLYDIEESLSWVLTSARQHVINVEKLASSSRWCSLVPVGQESRVRSTGLKWNLDDQLMKFGELISTSNELSGTVPVTVQTTAPLLWTVHMP